MLPSMNQSNSPSRCRIDNKDKETSTHTLLCTFLMAYQREKIFCSEILWRRPALEWTKWVVSTLSNATNPGSVASFFKQQHNYNIFKSGRIFSKKVQRYKATFFSSIQELWLLPYCNEISRIEENKAGCTATPVACGWAGAVMEKVTGVFGQE